MKVNVNKHPSMLTRRSSSQRMMLIHRLTKMATVNSKRTRKIWTLDTAISTKEKEKKGLIAPWPGYGGS